MPRFSITIDARTLKALAEQAADQRRDVRDQAAYSLTRDVEREKRRTAKQKEPRDRQP